MRTDGRWWAAVALLLAAGCGGSGDRVVDGGGDAGPAAQAWARVEVEPVSGFTTVESYTCRPDAAFVAVRGGSMQGIFKLELEEPAQGWTKIYDQSATICAVPGHLVVALPQGRT